jgi:hypothetical protein
MCSPIVITMASRRADLEQAARNHGISLAQIAEGKTKAPELTAAWKSLMPTPTRRKPPSIRTMTFG